MNYYLMLMSGIDSVVRRARREDGQGTLEWILIAVALVIIAWVAYSQLGDAIVAQIRELTGAVEQGNAD